MGRLIVAFGIVAAFSTQVAAEECTLQKLTGTWKLTSAVYAGTPYQAEPGSVHLKFVTSTHSMWIDYDKTGKINAGGGGPFRVSGGTVREQVGYRLDESIPLGVEIVFLCSLDERGRWHHKGQIPGSVTIDEIYERVPPADKK